ncbi:MAG TPA: translocation/assembly module TamB domain-containing protein [Candidatus Binataceae bacterium]|nr:translocation/assembly module TamB domain-containing protein [Candidatus Binataceae bacterium]
MRYLKRALVALVLVPAVVVTALFIYTRTASFDVLLRAQLARYMTGNYRGEITLGRIDAPFPDGITLDRVVIRYRDAEVARIAKVRAHYSILPLLWGAIHLRVEVLEPVINLNRGRDGKWNLLEALSPKTSGAPGSGTVAMSIHLDSVSVRDGSIEVAPDGPHGAKYRFGNAGIQLRAAILLSGTRVSISRLTARIEAPGFPAATAEGSLTYQDISAPARVAISHFNLRTRDSMVSLAGTLGDFDRMNVEAELTAGKLAAADLARIFPDYKINQDLSGTLTLKGAWHALHVGLALEAGSARLGAQMLADLAAKAPRYDAKITLTDLNARTLLGAAYPAGVIGASLTVHGAGTALADLAGEARLSDRGVVANGLRLGDATLNATIKNGSARFNGAITNGRSNVTAEGTVLVSADPRYRIAAAASHLDLARIFAARTTYPSDLNFTLGLDGGGLDLARMNSAVRIRLTRSTLAQFAFASGAVDARIANGRAIVSRATLTSQGTVVEANGTIGLARDTPAQLSYRLRAASLAPWLKLARLDGDGKLAVNGTAAGRLDDLRAKGTLTADKMRVGNKSVAHAQVSYDFGGIGQATPYGTLAAALDDIAAGIRLRRIEAKLKLRRGGPGRVNLALTAEDSAGGRDAVTANFGWQPQTVAGRLTEVELALPDGTWRLEAPVDFGKTARAVTLDHFRLRNGARTLTLNGSIAWNGEQNFVLDANRIDLADFKSIVPLAQGARGALALEVKVSGTAAAPIVDARLAATRLEVDARRIGNLDLKARYATQSVTIDAALEQDAGHRLTATGTLPAALQWAQGGTARIGADINLHVRSAGLRVGPLGALAPGMVKAAAGLLALDLTLGGPIERPRVNGTIALDGGRAEIVPLGVTVSDVVARMRVSPDELRVVSLTARAGDGTLAGNGAIALADDAPGEIGAQLNFHNWPAIATRRYQATIDSHLTARGTSAAPSIGGTIDVLHATLRPDLDFLTASSTVAPDPTIIVIEPGAKPPSHHAGIEHPAAGEQPSRFNRMAIDVRVDIHRDSWIRHQDAEVELEGDLRIIKKPAAAIRIVGAVRTVRGWIDFQNRRFDLAKGTINFTGGDRIDPSLDIDARYKITSYVIGVLIGGTANKPALKLTSQPELPQADILSLLLFGKTTSALGQGQQATLRQQATNMAAGYAASSIGQTVVQSLGLQALGLQMSGVSDAGGTIGFGHYLTQNTYVSVSQQFGGTNGQTGASTQGVSVQYYILSWLSVKSTSYSDGSREIDLNLTKRY